MQKVVLITGASSGLGLATALHLSEKGFNVYGTSRDPKKYKEKLPFDLLPLEITDRDSINKCVNEVINRSNKIDILINNAGITRDNLFMRMSEEDWNEVINVNLNSIFKLTKHLIKGMIKRRYGRIINITSVIGVAGGAGQSNYSASKAGIIAMSKSLAQEVGSRSVTVNSIAPGFIETNMTAELSDDRKEEILHSISVGRLGKPDDIAGAVCFLASDKASYITGQTIHINGGMLMI